MPGQHTNEIKKDAMIGVGWTSTSLYPGVVKMCKGEDRTNGGNEERMSKSLAKSPGGGTYTRGPGLHLQPLR